MLILWEFGGYETYTVENVPSEMLESQKSDNLCITELAKIVNFSQPAYISRPSPESLPLLSPVFPCVPLSQPLLRINSPLNIPNQPPLRRFPAEPTPRLLARTRIINLHRPPQKPKPTLRLLSLNTHNLDSSGLANRLRNALGGDPLLGNSMRSRPRSGLLNRQAKQLGGIEAGAGRPDIGSLAHIRGLALLRGGLEEQGYEAVIALAVVRGRQTNHTGSHTPLRKGQRGRFRSPAQRSQGVSLIIRLILVAEAGLREAQRAGRGDEGFICPLEGGAHGFDGGAVFGAAGGEVGEVVVEGQVDDAVRSGGGGFQGGQVVDGTAVGLRAEGFEL